jgi:hypothetical protein
VNISPPRVPSARVCLARCSQCTLRAMLHTGALFPVHAPHRVPHLSRARRSRPSRSPRVVLLTTFVASIGCPLRPSPASTPETSTSGCGPNWPERIAAGVVALVVPTPRWPGPCLGPRSRTRFGRGCTADATTASPLVANEARRKHLALLHVAAAAPVPPTPAAACWWAPGRLPAAAARGRPPPCATTAAPATFDEGALHR